MATSIPSADKKKPQLSELRATLAQRIEAIVGASGDYDTSYPGLTLFLKTAPSPCYMTSVEPSLSLFLRGRKRINIGSEVFLCDESSFLVACIDVPIQSQVLEASVKSPQVAMRMRLDMPTVREVLSREELSERKTYAERRGLALGKTTEEMIHCASRLLDLLDTPEDMPFLGPLIEREIIYRILKTPQGERLRSIATSGNLSHRAAKAIAWLSENFSKPLHIEKLADIANMGVSTLHHQFRTLTAMSPLQFQKQLRLQTARQRMFLDGLDATSAAYEVGYESVSQFNREYRRFFGQPPMRDIRELRNSIQNGEEPNTVALSVSIRD